METWDAIRARRDVRDFEARPIPAADLDRVLEAGRRAPSSQNWQPWNFVVVTGADQLKELSGVWQGARHVAGAAAAVAMIAAVPDSAQRRDRTHYDLGQATMSMMLAATDLGIGTAHSSVADQELAQRLLAFPDGYFCVYLMSLGYPADRPLVPLARPDRRPFDEVVHRERW